MNVTAMRSVKFLAVVLLFAGCASRANAVLPSGVSLNGGKHCNSYKHAVTTSAGSNTVSCDMSNVVSGDVVLIGINFVNTLTYSVTGTETPTCPTQLKKVDTGGNDHAIQGCYLTLASSHADFNITVTMNTQDISRQVALEVWELAGLGAVDTGSRTAVNAKTTSFTTAADNEFAFTFASDLCDQISPSGSNDQFGMMNSADDTQVNYRQLDMTQTTGTAGSYTSAYTSTGSSGANVQFLIVVAFAISGGHPQPSIYPNQQSQYLFADVTVGSKTVYFQNTLNGSKGVVSYHETGTSTARTCTVSTGETCVCLSGSYITHTYSSVVYGQQICYTDFTSAHSGIVKFSINDPGNASTFDFLDGREMVGLQTGADTASASSAAAITVNYTTLNANEWTYGLGVDGSTTYAPNLMTPGNSFSPAVNGFSDKPGSIYMEGMAADIVTVSSGSNTFSYSMTSSSIPLISVAAFTPSTSSPYRNHSSVI
jgi:hypothetical protein